MTENKSKFVYLAGPIDGAHHQEVAEMRSQIRQKLTSEGHVVFDPFAAFTQTENTLNFAAAVSAINRDAISRTDLVLCYTTKEFGRGFGTVREIEFAKIVGKPVVVIADEPLKSIEAHDLYQRTLYEFFATDLTLSQMLKEENEFSGRTAVFEDTIR